MCLPVEARVRTMAQRKCLFVFIPFYLTLNARQINTPFDLTLNARQINTPFDLTLNIGQIHTPFYTYRAL